jgi:tetratricopeptide (TPR) repeat protein
LLKAVGKGIDEFAAEEARLEFAMWLNSSLAQMIAPEQLLDGFSKCLDKLSKEVPSEAIITHPNVLVRRGNLNLDAGHFAKAAEDYKKALKLDKNFYIYCALSSDVAAYMLAVALVKNNSDDKAAKGHLATAQAALKAKANTFKRTMSSFPGAHHLFDSIHLTEAIAEHVKEMEVSSRPLPFLNLRVIRMSLLTFFVSQDNITTLKDLPLADWAVLRKQDGSILSLVKNEKVFATASVSGYRGLYKKTR